MFNQLLKWTIIVGLWRKYKSHVVASILLFISLILVNYIHLDFVEYSTATGSESLGLSYGIKWLAFLALAIIYAIQIKRINKNAKYDSKLHKMMKTKPSPKADVDKCSKQSLQTDPFTNIRNKKKLRSEADFLMEKED